MISVPISINEVNTVVKNLSRMFYLTLTWYVVVILTGCLYWPDLFCLLWSHLPVPAVCNTQSRSVNRSVHPWECDENKKKRIHFISWFLRYCHFIMDWFQTHMLCQLISHISYLFFFHSYNYLGLYLGLNLSHHHVSMGCSRY